MQQALIWSEVNTATEWCRDLSVHMEPVPPVRLGLQHTNKPRSFTLKSFQLPAVTLHLLSLLEMAEFGHNRAWSPGPDLLALI